MAPRLVTLGAAALVCALILAPLGAVIWRAEGLGRLGPADWAAVRFTLVQAVLSSALSVLVAVPVARALARRRFPGRGVLITLLGAPFILPAIVAVLGLLTVFGQNGLVSTALVAVGLPPLQIYGLGGVVLAHVFFNLPLATRLILQGWLAIPSERFRLAGALGLSPWTVFRLLELPMLRRVLPGIASVIFVICLSSFAVALTLGGGPKATTVELAIYQAFRFDFDLGKAALLALVQLGLTAAAAGVALWVGTTAGFGAGLDRPRRRWDADAGGQRLLDAVWIALAAAFLIVPLAAIVLGGLGSLPNLPPAVWTAAGHSLQVAAIATTLCLMLALPLARSASGEGVSLLGLALSPLVLGAGLFLLVQPFASPFQLALPVTALVNAVISLPFAVRALRPALETAEADYGRLADMLGLQGWARWRWVILPRIRRPLGFAAGLTAALSIGDLGVIALFADPERATLPLQMYRLMGAYRMDQAAGAALLLLTLSLSVFWLLDRGGRVNAEV